MADPQFPTIRQEALIYGLLSEHRLRILLKEGKLPGFYSGNRFLINHKALVNMLDVESMKNVKEAE